MDRNELDGILEQHRKWWLPGPSGKRADLRDADLGGADLGGADLRGAYLGGADLRGADLGRAYLSGADLGGADLRDADLGGAYLSGADLRYNKYLIGCTLTNYPMVAFMHQNSLCVTCGCRRGLTVEEARKHWSPDNLDKWTEKKSEWGEQRLRQIDFLEAEARHLGWIK